MVGGMGVQIGQFVQVKKNRSFLPSRLKLSPLLICLNMTLSLGILYDVESNSILIQLSSSLIYHLSLSLPLPSTLSPSSEYTRESRTLFEYLLQGTSGNGVKRKKLSLNDGAKVLGCVPIIGDSKGKGKGFEFGYIFE